MSHFLQQCTPIPAESETSDAASETCCVAGRGHTALERRRIRPPRPPCTPRGRRIVTVTAGLRAPSRDAAARLCAPPSSATAAALVFRTTAHGAPEGNDEHGTARDTDHGHSILLALDRLGGGLGDRGHHRDLIGPVHRPGSQRRRRRRARGRPDRDARGARTRRCAALAIPALHLPRPPPSPPTAAILAA